MGIDFEKLHLIEDDKESNISDNQPSMETLYLVKTSYGWASGFFYIDSSGDGWEFPYDSQVLCLCNNTKYEIDWIEIEYDENGISNKFIDMPSLDIPIIKEFSRFASLELDKSYIFYSKKDNTWVEGIYYYLEEYSKCFLGLLTKEIIFNENELPDFSHYMTVEDWEEYIKKEK